MKPQDLLKNWLRKNNMTAKDLAEKAGTNHSGIYRYLNGDTDSMRVSSALVLAHATNFELDVCDILGIPPRIVYRCLLECKEECKKEDYSYTVDPSVCGINTPSSRISTYSVESKKTRQKKIPSNAISLLEHWVVAFAKQPSRVKLSPKRERAFNKAIENDWSIDDLKNSISGHAANPWRHQEPSRNEFATLLRPENIESGLEEYVAPPPPVDDTWVLDEQKKRG